MTGRSARLQQVGTGLAIAFAASSFAPLAPDAGLTAIALVTFLRTATDLALHQEVRTDMILAGMVALPVLAWLLRHWFYRQRRRNRRARA